MHTNVAKKNFRSHSEPLFKQLGILKFPDKLSYCRCVFMHKYRHGKVPVSFSGIFTDTKMTDEMQSLHNDYNYLNEPAIKKCLENFPLKQIIFNWNAMSIELKSTAELAEFELLLKEKYLSQYSLETDCQDNCYSCNYI